MIRTNHENFSKKVFFEASSSVIFREICQHEDQGTSSTRSSISDFNEIRKANQEIMDDYRRKKLERNRKESRNNIVSRGLKELQRKIEEKTCPPHLRTVRAVIAAQEKGQCALSIAEQYKAASQRSRIVASKQAFKDEKAASSYAFSKPKAPVKFKQDKNSHRWFYPSIAQIACVGMVTTSVGV